jgi:hypothetical protein
MCIPMAGMRRRRIYLTEGRFAAGGDDWYLRKIEKQQNEVQTI